MILLAVRDDRLGFAELVEHDHQLAALDLLHFARQQVAELRGELIPNLGTLALTNPLDDPLLRRLHGGATEDGKIDGLLEHVADLEVILELPSVVERDFLAGIFDGFDDGLEQDDLDAAAVVIDLDLCLHIRAVLFRECGHDAVLQQTVELRTLDLLDVRDLAKCRQDVRRADHHTHPLYQIRNASRASFTAESGTWRSFPFISSVAPSAPTSPATSTSFPSNRPPCSGASTETHRPTNRRHSAGDRNGRSPGDDTCSSYRSGTNPLSSSFASNALDTRAQSSTVTLPPSRRSIRTSTSGRPFVPPFRSSTSSYPAESSSAMTTVSSVAFTLCRRYPTRTKKCGEPPPHF